MNKFWNILKNVFLGYNNNLVGLKYLNEQKIEKELPKPPAKKEYKLSELLKKTAIE